MVAVRHTIVVINSIIVIVIIVIVIVIVIIVMVMVRWRSGQAGLTRWRRGRPCTRGTAGGRHRRSEAGRRRREEQNEKLAKWRRRDSVSEE